MIKWDGLSWKVYGLVCAPFWLWRDAQQGRLGDLSPPDRMASLRKAELMRALVETRVGDLVRRRRAKRLLKLAYLWPAIKQGRVVSFRRVSRW